RAAPPWTRSQHYPPGAQPAHSVAATTIAAMAEAGLLRSGDSAILAGKVGKVYDKAGRGVARSKNRAFLRQRRTQHRPATLAAQGSLRGGCGTMGRIDGAVTVPRKPARSVR